MELTTEEVIWAYNAVADRISQMIREGDKGLPEYEVLLRLAERMAGHIMSTSTDDFVNAVLV